MLHVLLTTLVWVVVGNWCSRAEVLLFWHTQRKYSVPKLEIILVKIVYAKHCSRYQYLKNPSLFWQHPKNPGIFHRPEKKNLQTKISDPGNTNP